MAKRYFRKAVNLPDEVTATMRGEYLELPAGQRIVGVLEFRMDSRYNLDNWTQVVIEEDVP